ncbi:L-threonine dehydratase biosynthetic IlvA, partial [Geodia barretti]
WRARHRLSLRRNSPPGSAARYGSSARTFSRSSRSSCAAPTTSSRRSRLRNARGGSSRRRPAIMRRAWRLRAHGSALARSSSCRRRRPASRWTRSSGWAPRCSSRAIRTDGARERAEALAAERGMVLIPPYDDEHVIAGQGTVAMEIVRQQGEAFDAIFVSVGGGGPHRRHRRLHQGAVAETRIIGVEPQDAPTLHAALAAGERVVLEQVGTFADGVAVKQIGAEPFRIARECIDEVVLVSTDEICAAIKDIFEDTRAIAEPAGALAVAGLKRYVEREGIADGRRFAAIVSGANVNFDRLRHIAQRAQLGEQREILLAVTIPERPGSLLRFCELIGKRSITEFNYRYADDADAHIFVGVEISGTGADGQSLVDSLERDGYPVLDLTDNEMAKLHVRYMVGGHAPGELDEVLYRFDFPERPGALMHFLTQMGRKPWNISMFHYRNHGSDYGRVLIGLQVPQDERGKFRLFLEQVGYDYREETANPAYRLFLR